MGPVPTNLGSSLCRVIWPASRFEPSAFAAEIPTARLHPDPWVVFQAARGALLTNAVPLAYEIGNEPDLYFTPDLPDRMALTLKAAWWAIKSVQPKSRVLMPSLAARPGPYAEMLLANRVASYTDAWNLHLYGWAQDFSEGVAEHRQFLTRTTGKRLPLWVTEIGFAEFPAVPPPIPDVLLARQRAFFERVTVSAPFDAIAQQWAFVLGPQLEQGQDYGLNNADGSPRPALEALLELSRWLRQGRPVFEVRRRSDSAVVGYVFARESPESVDSRSWGTLLVSPHRRADFSLPEVPGGSSEQQPEAAPETSLWEAHLEFPHGYGPVRLGLNGEWGETAVNRLKFVASAATNLFLYTPPRPFSVAGCDWVPVSPSVRSRAERSERIPAPGPVVISFAFETNQVRADKASVAYRYAPRKALRLVVRGDNFGVEAVNGHWHVRLPAGWRVTEGELQGWMQVPAGGTARRELKVHPRDSASFAERQKLVVRWSGDDGHDDQAAGWLAPQGDENAPFAGEELSGDWQPTEAEAIWQRTELPGGGARWQLRELRPGVTTGLLLTLPGSIRLRPDDVLRFRLRAADADSHFRRRLDLITVKRQVFRLGDDWPVGEAWQTVEMRVGDFTPAFWSRTDSTRRNGPAAARYFRVGLFGVAPGATVELGPLELRRARSSR